MTIHQLLNVCFEKWVVTDEAAKGYAVQTQLNAYTIDVCHNDVVVRVVLASATH